MFPSELLELAIYKYVDVYGQKRNATIPDLLRAVGTNTPYYMITERLKDLNSHERIRLFAYSVSFENAQPSFSQVVGAEGEGAFWAGSFVIEIAPQGRRYFEELEERSKQEKRASETLGSVFISCGQYTEREKGLGKNLARAVEIHTAFRGYFAESQNSLDSLSRHIFNALNQCVGFVAVMHRRGEVKFPDGNCHIRGSVWIEQEVAIAAFLAQVYQREFPIAFYIQKGIRREGVREQLRLDPVEFKDESEVLAHFTERLAAGTFKPFLPKKA